MTEQRRCRIVDAAKELVDRIESQELPPDFEPGDLHYNQILAHIRHQYTNYEELLWSLPLCVDFWDNEDGREYCAELFEEGEPCPLGREAHDILKWAAKTEAAKVYQKWV